MDSYRSKLLISIFISALLVGCGVFGGVSIDIGPGLRKSEAVHTPEMTLTIPEKTELTEDSKTQFLVLIDETIKKLLQSNRSEEKRIENLRKFSSLLSQATSEEDLYRSLKKCKGEESLVNCAARAVEQVLFTGYYKPLFKGSLRRSANYAAPLYGIPKAGTNLSRKNLVTSGVLKSQELIYLKDPFEAYLAEVQGSVGIVLESGQIVHYAFAGSNNQKYVSIGSELVTDGKLTKSEATIAGIRNYFQSNPGKIQEYIYRNPRQVFFRKSSGKTLGSSGVELLSERAVATDRLIYPPGSILFVRVEIPAKQANGVWGTKLISKFMIALDSGSAIIGPKRVDLFLGEGSEVGEVAGRLNSRGKLEVFE